MTDQPYINLCEYSQTDYPVNYQDYKKICLSFAKSIKYIVSENAFSHNKDSLKEICSYLNYWLNRELRNAKKPNMDAKEFYNKLNAHGLSGNFHINKCHDNIKNIYDPVFADLQYLYKLFSSINLYRTSYSIHHKWDCNAANECFTLYDERVSECDMKDNTSFCKKLKEFHSMYNKTMGTNTCQGVPTSLGPFGKKTEHVANRQGSLTANQETPHDNYYKKLISNAQTPFISSVGVISTFVLF
ncbi:hypothetical protein PVBG_06179 [Plasmodium vivax Brazil I]|uniref:Variable surface protein Vir7-like protein n=1 Tax=Plasmodium vivax (strain Brazil I) TaxID=1033975 RepID=A0A0J9T2Q1_PLAV1|nr:hypothetical protein PVBG_06179 [Plasmodium vivax Brazil I]